MSEFAVLQEIEKNLIIIIYDKNKNREKWRDKVLGQKRYVI